MERVKGIEPSWPAWKAGALPLSYTRLNLLQRLFGGGSRIRTCVDVRRQIYSLLPLTARPSLQANIIEGIRDLKAHVNWEVHTGVVFLIESCTHVLNIDLTSTQVATALARSWSLKGNEN
jgi:hypothetical protein